jgi:hypothetical protein
MWYNWDAVDWPWKNLLKIRDKTDRVLFFASTVITVGDGKHTPFWEAQWLNGMSPMCMAPNLYLQARYKFRSGHKELQNYNWIKNLKLINTEVLLEEFLLLFHALNDVSLNKLKDTIFWRWNRSGRYTAASAYDMQFLGAYSTFRASTIWQAKTEPKCRFLALVGDTGEGTYDRQSAEERLARQSKLRIMLL